MQKGFSALFLIIVVFISILAVVSYRIVLKSINRDYQLAKPKSISDSRIIFYQDGTLWVANEDGTNIINTGIPEYADHNDDASKVGKISFRNKPTLSPDGSWIAYVKENNIYKVNIETSEEKLLTDTGIKETDEYYGTQPISLKWSPDGKYVSYVLAIDGCVGVCEIIKKDPRGVNTGLWIVDSEGNYSRFLIPYSGINVVHDSYVYTAWLPTGDTIIYSEFPPKESWPVYGLRKVSISDFQIRDYELQVIAALDWSLDGKKIVYATVSRIAVNTQGIETFKEALDKIYLLEGHEYKVIFENVKRDPYLNPDLLDLSPDGTKLIFNDNDNYSLNTSFISYRVVDLAVNKEFKFAKASHSLPFENPQEIFWTDDSKYLIIYDGFNIQTGNLEKILSMKYDGSDTRLIIDFN